MSGALAEEIADLRAQVAQLTHERDRWHSKWLIDRLTAKLERYEAALREIATSVEPWTRDQLIDRAAAALTQPQEASDA